MKRITLTIALSIPFLLLGQVANKGTFKVRKQVQNTEVFSIAQEMPSFPGGEAALFKFLAENTVYPDSALVNGINGTVYVRFIVKKDGGISDVEVMRGADPLLDAEAIRVIKLMPNWSPGKNREKLVNVFYNLPIRFRLK